METRVLVTSGPTRAWLDAIRYISNTSSGALGAKIVEALINRGIPVTHLYGTGSMRSEINSLLLEEIEISTIEDIGFQVRQQAKKRQLGAVVHVMAVLDYAPEKRVDSKKSSMDACWEIKLVRTPKITALIRELLPDALTIGFKLESGVEEDELIRRAGESLRKYDLDLVVANILEKVGVDIHETVFVGAGDKVLARGKTKQETAALVADRIDSHFKERGVK